MDSATEGSAKSPGKRVVVRVIVLVSCDVMRFGEQVQVSVLSKGNWSGPPLKSSGRQSNGGALFFFVEIELTTIGALGRDLPNALLPVLLPVPSYQMRSPIAPPSTQCRGPLLYLSCALF